MEELINSKNYLSNENFVVPQEITVTITLEEYRRLVQTTAKAELYKQQKSEYELKQEIANLKNQVDRLKNQLINTIPPNNDDCSCDCCSM